MSVLDFDIKTYGPLNTQETDSGTVGGGVDVNTLIVFDDMLTTSTIDLFSSSASDTTPVFTVYGRDAGGDLISEAETLNGKYATKLTTTSTFERILRVKKTGGSAAVGWVAAMSSTTAAQGTGTAQGGANSTSSLGPYIQLAASNTQAVDFYNGMVLHLDGGTGIDDIRRIIDFDDTNERAYVESNFSSAPDGTTTYRIAPGCVMSLLPTVVTEVRRLHYDVAAPASGGDIVTYDKFFQTNTHATIALTNPNLAEVTGGVASQSAIGLEGSMNDTTSITNRLTAPGGISFTTDQTDVAFAASLTAGDDQGCWHRLTLTTSDVATNDVWKFKVTGQSV